MAARHVVRRAAADRDVAQAIDHCYPYVVFYFEVDDRVEVWRVLHARRDLPSSLQATEET